MNTESNRILLTGGRAPATLELSRLFAKAGYEVYVADSLAFQLAKASNTITKTFIISSPVHSFNRFIEDLLRVIKHYRITLLFPTCEEVFYIAKGKEILEQYCDVFCPAPAFLLSLHHKYRFIEIVKEKGLSAPESFLAHSKEEIFRAVNQLNGKAVVKPAYSRFGSQVIFIDKKNMNEICLSDGVYVVQECIKGKPICSYSIFHEGKLLAHTQYYVKYTAGNSASIHFQHVEHPAIEAWVRQFFQGSQVTGQFAFDFIEEDSGNVMPLECNPRTTSGIHLFKELPLAEQILNTDAEMLQPSFLTNRMVGLAMLIYGWRNRPFLDWVKTMARSRDVIWAPGDVRPFFYQFYSYYRIFRLSRRLGKSPMEASTFDIEWNGDDQ